MKYATIAVAGCVLAGLLGTAAYAQHVPQGSYTQSCRNIRVAGGTLLAVCRQADGRWETSALAQVGTCASDIGNMNGALACDRGVGFGSGRIEGQRDQERRLRCEGIIDQIARWHCLSGF
jgi:hypothetical protein